MWAALDKNKDNVWQYDEFPHPDWKRANRDGDEGLSWKEELADQTFRRQSKTYPKKYGSTSQKEWPHQQAWDKDRADCKTLFTFIDWNNDGKITTAEYEVFETQLNSYNDGSYPKTNEQGETGMEVFKRLSSQTQKAELNPNAKPEKKQPTQKTSTGSGSPAWVGDRFSTDIPKYKADEPLKLLPPEVELAIMKKLHTYDKIMNIQLMPSNTSKDEQADDVTGEWLIFTTMTHGQGMHKLTLKQQGEKYHRYPSSIDLWPLPVDQL